MKNSIYDILKFKLGEESYEYEHKIIPIPPYKFLENNLSLEPYEYFGEISSILGYRIKQAILYFNADILMRVELKYKGDIVLNLKSKLEESQLNFSSIMFLKLYFNQEENLSVLMYQKKLLLKKVID